MTRLTLLGIIAGVLATSSWMAAPARAESFAGGAGQSLGFSLSATPVAGADADDISVRVLDDATGAALSDATVSVGDSLQDEGSAALRGQTGAQGSFLVKGALSRGARALTVSKEGYATISIGGLQSPQVTVYLKARPLAFAGPTVLASGEMASWPGMGDSDTVTAGIALQSLSALNLLNFSTESFISPLKDTIELAGSHQVPSNFMMPDQDLSVFFLPVHLSKPSFRLPLARGPQVQLAAVQGTIAVSDLISLAQGGKISMGLLNKLTFTRAGLTAPMATDQDFHTTIDASNELSPRLQVTPIAPPFASDILVAAVTDMDGSRSVLLPTDIKLASSVSDNSQIQTVSLSGPDSSVGAAQDVVTFAMADKGRRISGILSGNVGPDVAPGEFLPADAISDAVTVPDTVALPSVATGLAAVIYEVQGAPVWYVYALPGSAAPSFLSRRLAAPALVTSYSVLSLDFGSGFDARTLDGQKIMTQLQRFGRSSAKIGQPAPQP